LLHKAWSSRHHPPRSPKYLAEGLPKQDTETLYEIQSYVESLIEYRDQSVDADELHEAAEPVDEPDSGDNGTVVKEKVTCGDDSCKVRQRRSRGYTRPVSLSLLS